MHRTLWRSTFARLRCGMTLALALFVSSSGIGCDSRSTSDRSLSFVSPTQAEELLAGERTLLGGAQSAVWVDPRPSEDYQAGHIAGAINMPYERVSLDYPSLKQYDIVIVYGADYDDVRARGMSKRLKELRGGDVRTLNGGLRAWQDAGHELETGHGDSAP